MFRYPGLEALKATLSARVDDQELPLPGDRDASDGEWLLAEFIAEEGATVVPACVRDRGDGLCLCFQERDWQRLLGFAAGESGCGQCGHGDAAAIACNATVLLVDTDSTVLSIVGAMLGGCGLGTETVHSAEEALDRLHRRHFDLVVVEPALLGMSGLELCRQLRTDARLADVPILVLASHTTGAEVREVLCSGADDFVGKPFRAHELRARALGLIQKGKSAAVSRRLPA